MKRMMIFTVLFLTLFSFRVCAEDCFVSELGVSLTLPEGYSIINHN